jgi:DNA-binding MarR family transcriptional regulator
MSHRPRQKEKTQRAFRAYLDLIDTAQWIEGQLRAPLESFDLTMAGFRLLELLYREGALPIADAARKRMYQRPNLDIIIDRLEERGWVRRAEVTLPPVEMRASRLPKSKRGQKRTGRRILVIGLTPLGKKFIGNVLPSHSKLVKALMRAIDGRKQETLSQICRQLREGDVLKFVSEMTHEDVGD